MNLNQDLIITYSNQKARELKKSLKNPLDKVVTLQFFVNEFSEKHSFKTLIEPIIATSFIYKTIKDENIEYLDFISLNSDTLDLIYDFILKTNASKVDLSEIIKDDKLKAIKLLSSKYSEFKNKNNLVDMNDVFQLAIDNFEKNDFSKYSKIYLDNFIIENVKFYKSNLELELLELFSKISIPLEQTINSNSTAKLHKLNKQPFDINDEVESALKLSRKLLEDDEGLASNDICIVTTDIGEYAPIFRLYLPKYELKGFDSKGISLKLFNSKKTSKQQVKIGFDTIEKELKFYTECCKKYEINLDLVKLKEKLISDTYILEDKIGIELTEANQLIGLNKQFEHIIFIGTDINHFPPKRSDNFLFTSNIAQKYFCENSYYENSLLQYNLLKKLAKNLYILHPKYKEKRELSSSIIIDKNIENLIDISNIQAKKEKIENEDFLISITSNEFTKYDGLDVQGLNANHLSASQLGSYAKCPLKYLYINKLRIRAPREDEDGFDVAQMGTLMHSCFESFAKKVQGNKTLAIESFKSIMFDVLQEEYQSFINNPDNEIKEENIYHILYKYTLTRGLQDDKVDGLLIKFIMYYQENKEELNYFINSEFEKEFALDSDLKPYKLVDENDKNYFIKGYIDRFDNLENQVNIIDYKSKKANTILQDKIDEIINFKDFQLGLYTLFATQEYKKDVDSYLLTFKSDNSLYTKFARVTTNNELIPQNRGKNTGVWYDEEYKDDLKANILLIKEKIEQGNFRFDSSDDTYCGYCELRFMCNKSLLIKNINS